MSGIRLAAHLRERERASPRLLLRALNDPAEHHRAGRTRRSAIARCRRSRSRPAPAPLRSCSTAPRICRRWSAPVTSTTSTAIPTTTWSSPIGRTSAACKRAHTLSFQLNGVEVQRLTLKEVTVDAPMPANTFAVSDDVKAKAKTAAADAPYQWVLRRMFLGRFLDSDKVYFPEGGGFRLAELAPNVQHVVGGSANNLIVAMKDGIVIFDAPVDEGQSRWVIDAAKAKYPGKPIKQLVLTHHHMDHTGGTRAYVAEGAEIVIPGQARPFFEKMLQAEHKLAPDALARQPKPAKIVDVKDTMSLKDETIEVTLYNIPNPHADGMIIAHVVGPEPGVGHRPDLAARAGRPHRPTRSRWATPCARPASPDRPSSAVTAPPPSRPTSPPRWRRTRRRSSTSLRRRSATSGAPWSSCHAAASVEREQYKHCAVADFQLVIDRKARSRVTVGYFASPPSAWSSRF